MKWQKVAAVSDFIDTDLCEVAVGNDLVLLVRRGADVHAVAGLCTHAFARLSGGRVDADGHLNCPRHLARFSLEDGRCLSGWAVPPLKRYAVRIDGDDILLTNPLTSLA
ncbi:MAG: Rieske (2Fe-2S) protein [Pseudomonadota bacterium]